MCQLCLATICLGKCDHSSRTVVGTKTVWRKWSWSGQQRIFVFFWGGFLGRSVIRPAFDPTSRCTLKTATITYLFARTNTFFILEISTLRSSFFNVLMSNGENNVLARPSHVFYWCILVCLNFAIAARNWSKGKLFIFSNSFMSDKNINHENTLSLLVHTGC